MKLRSIAALFIIGSLLSCEDDKPAGPVYDFIDQDASGLITNEPWTYEDGHATGYTSGDKTNYTIRLRLQQAGSGCDAGLVQGRRMYFNVEGKVGVYKVTGDTYMFFSDDVNDLNSDKTEGAIEIVSVTSSLITGRIDVRLDEENYVNGNFTVSNCGF